MFQIDALAGGECGEVANLRGLLVQNTASFSHRTGLHECSVKWRRLLDTDTDLSGYQLNSVGGLECVSQHVTEICTTITSCQMHPLNDRVLAFARQHPILNLLLGHQAPVSRGLAAQRCIHHCAIDFAKHRFAGHTAGFFCASCVAHLPPRSIENGQLSRLDSIG